MVGSPVQVPTQRSSRSDSVTAAHTDSIGARNVRSKHDAVVTVAVSRGGRWASGVMLSPPTGSDVGGGSVVADGAADLEVEAVEHRLVEPGSRAQVVEQAPGPGPARRAASA